MKFQPGKNEKILKPMVNQSPTIKCENMMKLGYFKEDTSTAVGVAKPSAHGQATTCIQDTHVTIAWKRTGRRAKHSNTMESIRD
jgi:hypothetical protein